MAGAHKLSLQGSRPTGSPAACLINGREDTATGGRRGRRCTGWRWWQYYHCSWAAVIIVIIVNYC